MNLLDILLESQTLAEAEPVLVCLAGGKDFTPWAWGVFDGWKGRPKSYVPFSPRESRRKRLENLYDDGFDEGAELRRQLRAVTGH